MWELSPLHLICLNSCIHFWDSPGQLRIYCFGKISSGTCLPISTSTSWSQWLCFVSLLIFIYRNYRARILSPEIFDDLIFFSYPFSLGILLKVKKSSEFKFWWCYIGVVFCIYTHFTWRNSKIVNWFTILQISFTNKLSSHQKTWINMKYCKVKKDNLKRLHTVWWMFTVYTLAKMQN